MSINSISTSTNSYLIETQTARSQRAEAFRQLASSLQSGDLAGAQSAFTALKPKNSPQSPQQPQSQMQKDFQALSAALNSGNISSAQQAFSTIQQDMQKAFSAHGHRRPDQEGDDSRAPSAPSMATPSTVGTTINELA